MASTGSPQLLPPERLWVVRHGQSVGNVAAEAAAAAGAELLDLTTRDVDTPLSDLGAQQSAALGRWMAKGSFDTTTRVIASPYLRAQQTARLALDAAGGRLAKLPVGTDERLRDRELGTLDGLTTRGIEVRFPELWAQRTRVGKFYQRPPGGESWTDVLLRLRSLHQSLLAGPPDEHILIFSHDIAVLHFCYLYEDLDETQVLDLGRTKPVANASVTSFARVGDRLRLETYNEVAPLEEGGVPVTVQKEKVDGG
jgi:broad specificity phosphatase PhoE